MGLTKSRLKRRLRKKHHLGEFQELGFEILTELKPELSEKEFDDFLYEFIDEIERNKLLFSGGGNSTSWHGFVTSSKNFNSPTEGQRIEFEKWLMNRSEIKNAKIAKFRDAWHGWD